MRTTATLEMEIYSANVYCLSAGAGGGGWRWQLGSEEKGNKDKHHAVTPPKTFLSLLLLFLKIRY